MENKKSQNLVENSCICDVKLLRKFKMFICIQFSVKLLFLNFIRLSILNMK